MDEKTTIEKPTSKNQIKTCFHITFNCRCGKELLWLIDGVTCEKGKHIGLVICNNCGLENNISMEVLH